MHAVMSGPDFIVDIDGLRTPIDTEPARDSARPWLAVLWRCCNVYSRIYRSRSGKEYEGRCPRCQRSVTAKIGPGGTSSRFFEAS